MITEQELLEARQAAADLIRKSGLGLSKEEEASIEVADFGLSRLKAEGAQILTWFSTDRISGKVLALLPGQTEPEHWHPPVGADPGKEETVRMVYGDLYFYIPGEDTLREGMIPAGKESCYSSRHEIVMKPGDQLTLKPDTKHWFQAGPEGAVLFSFSTTVRDGLDRFTDPNVVRETRVESG